MPAIDFTRYYRYGELTDALNGFVAEYASLTTLSAIGTSHEGRTIWCLTVTNSATGSAEEKPAFWLDANILLIAAVSSFGPSLSCASTGVRFDSNRQAAIIIFIEVFIALSLIKFTA